MAVVLPIARILIPVVIAAAGAAVGYAARDIEADEEVKNRAYPLDLEHQRLSKKLRERASQLLRERKTKESVQKNRSAYLKQMYLGVYYIGRTGGKLAGTYAEALANELMQIHSQHRPKKDREIVNWYQTVGVSKEKTLAELLADCSEIKKLGVDPRYIAYAFGENHPNLEFGNLLDDMVDSIKV
jgi:hypothetical protein